MVTVDFSPVTTAPAPKPVQSPTQSALSALNKLPPALQLKLLKIRKARQHPNDFNAYCFIDKEGNPWTQTVFHKEWLDAYLKYDKLHVEAFRESAKTEQISIGASLWSLGKNPNLRIKVVSAGDDLAKSIIKAAGDHIKGNDRVHEVFPNLRPADEGEWNLQRLFIQRSQVMKDASLSAHGVLSAGVGGRCDILIFDDVCDYRNTILQPAMKQLVIRAVEMVWMKLVTPGGQIIWLDTPWASDDASAAVESYRDFYHIKHPIYKNMRRKSDGKVIETSRWPEKYSDEYLAAEEKARPVAFRTQMRLDRYVGRGEAYFPEEVILGAHDLLVPELGPPEPGHVYVSFWDLGRHVTKRGRNASVCVTLDITSYPAYIRHISSYVNVPYASPDPEAYCVSNEITRISRIYSGETVVEANAAGEAIVESLPVSVSLFHTTVATKTPMMQSLLNSLSNGSLKWKLIDDPNLVEMEAQLRGYTLQDDNIAQDFVIALAGAGLYISTEGGSGIVI